MRVYLVFITIWAVCIINGLRRVMTRTSSGLRNEYRSYINLNCKVILLATLATAIIGISIRQNAIMVETLGYFSTKDNGQWKL